jgi:dTDP-4-dehydrorhamnose reductase
MRIDEQRPLELWGGVECTLNRIGDAYLDQLERCGHYNRLDDLERIAELGIRRLRYPALWEHIAPGGLDKADWQATDETFDRLQSLGIEPIVGLVHHGSGPRSTSLLDDSFAAGLTEFATAFASRYPWVRMYTPVNEPLTTARFSCLYGHWYPHRNDDASFVRALLNQCQAVVAAMRAIRQVQPAAVLVQTEDAGFASGTAATLEQVTFENHRRWLSLDLLTGRLDRSHPLRGYLRAAGAENRALEPFAEPLDAMVIGMNYYVTSDRFLDDRVSQYPLNARGGNGHLEYADVAAAHVPCLQMRGHETVIREVWQRYERPVAITEAHLGSTREAQMRWLLEAWNAAHRAKEAGVDVRAVTAWALLGSWDWDSLVTRPLDHYETGAFDVRGDQPRMTGVGRVILDLAAGREPEHPVLATTADHVVDARASQPILILGSNGTLGGAFVRACQRRGLAHVALSHNELDIAEVAAVRQALAAHRPWAVVNGAGYVRVDTAERERQMCHLVNAVGPAVLAFGCRQTGVKLVTFSSDQVFDGNIDRPYVESDPVAPLNVYGYTKAEAERRVLALAGGSLIIRTSAFFAPWDRANCVTRALDSLAGGRSLNMQGHAVVSPTYVPDLVESSLDLLIDGAAGLWHLANRGAVTWEEFARRAATIAGVTPASHRAVREAEPVAIRPAYSALGTERGMLLPHWEDSLERYFRDRIAIAAAA